MEKKQGTVVSVDGKYAKMVFDRPSACISCSGGCGDACGGCGKIKKHTVDVENTLNAKSGDTVEVTVMSGYLTAVCAAIFVIPAAAAIILYFILGTMDFFTEHEPLQALITVFAAVILFAVIYILCGKVMKNKTTVKQEQIIRFGD